MITDCVFIYGGNNCGKSTNAPKFAAALGFEKWFESSTVEGMPRGQLLRLNAEGPCVVVGTIDKKDQDVFRLMIHMTYDKAMKMLEEKS